MRRFLAVCLFLLAIISSSFADFFPDKISENAKISVLAVDYDDFFHSIFSKNCLRIFDVENSFDYIIDFAHFENFDDVFFGLKFYFHPKKAFVKISPYLEYFLENYKKKNVKVIELNIDLSPKEIEYIFDFVKTLYAALPNYKYDFDILNNNSETHISSILHDAERMHGKQTTVSYDFTNFIHSKLNYKKINNDFVLLSDSQKLNFENQLFPKYEKAYKLPLVIFSVILISIAFLLSAYQMLVYYLEKFYLASVFSVVQIADFLIFFVAGFLGAIILFQDIFSSQEFFRNNFQFLYLFPLHFIVAFSFFKQFLPSKIQIYYWGGTSFLSLIYAFVLLISRNELPLVSFLGTLFFFFRTICFFLIAIDIKKRPKPNPYELLKRFLDFISS